MNIQDKIRVAVIGATGLVGQKLIMVLQERGFYPDQIELAASQRSAGKTMQVGNQNKTILTIQEVLESRPNVALFSAGGETAKEWAPTFQEAGVYVIDNSSAFRMTAGIPLVVPEINGNTLKSEDYLIANPNCSTIQLALALEPLNREFGLQKVVVSTYQSVTGSGQKAVDQLEAERKGETVGEKAYPYPIDMNCLPQCDEFLENGYTKEEMKVVNESRKLLNQSDLPISATAVRVPVTGGHSESTYVELNQTVSAEIFRKTIAETSGIRLLDDPGQLHYPMPLNAREKDDVFVGRIRQDLNLEQGWHFWIVADNLRKGAATNAVQILEKMISLGILTSTR